MGATYPAVTINKSAIRAMCPDLRPSNPRVFRRIKDESIPFLHSTLS